MPDPSPLEPIAPLLSPPQASVGPAQPTQGGTVQSDPLMQLGNAPTMPGVPQHFRELPDHDIAAFEADWKAHSTKGQGGTETRPDLYASFDQQQNTLTLSFADAKMNEHSVTLDVEGQKSVGRFSASEIAPGQYRLGDPKFGEHGAWLGHGSRAADDIPEGWASVPIRNADGANVVAASHDGTTILDGGDVMLHGGGSGVPQPFAPQQPLEATEACIRGHNADVLAVANMVRASGGSIPLQIESGVQSLNRSTDSGKTWAPVPNGVGMVGTVTKIEDGIVHQHAGRGEYQYKLKDIEARGFSANEISGKSMYFGVDAQGQSNIMTRQEYESGQSHGQAYQIERQQR